MALERGDSSAIAIDMRFSRAWSILEKPQAVGPNQERIDDGAFQISDQG
jgi:hypothetical protein